MKLEKENWNEKWAAEQKQYEKIWSSSYSFKRIREEITKRIKGKNLKICEFGCGGGLWLKWFKEAYNAEVFGIDNSKIGLKIARKNLERKAKLIFGDVIKKIPFKKESFDLVYCVGLIVHFNDEEIQRIINEMHRVIKKDGKIIVTTPNRARNSFLYLYKKFFGTCQSERIIEIKQLKKFLEKAGFKNIEIIPAGLFVPKLRNKKWFLKLNLKFLESFKTSDNIIAFARK